MRSSGVPPPQPAPWQPSGSGGQFSGLSFGPWQASPPGGVLCVPPEEVVPLLLPPEDEV
jgi:hypothetical protein